LVSASGITHEFRSIDLPPPPLKTLAPYFGEKDKAELALLVGNSPWNIRPFAPGNCLDPAWDTV
jgi:hypothetical protein